MHKSLFSPFQNNIYLFAHCFVVGDLAIQLEPQILMGKAHCHFGCGVETLGIGSI